MNVRELIDVLGVGDLDAEVYVAMPVEGPGVLAPLECLDDVSLEAADDESDLLAVVLWPGESRRRRAP